MRRRISLREITNVDNLSFSLETTYILERTIAVHVEKDRVELRPESVEGNLLILTKLN